MGYLTDFRGSMKIEPPLQGHHSAYLKKFFETRRMRWKQQSEKMPDPLREAVGLPFGTNGEFYVNAQGFMGQCSLDDPNVLEYNDPPGGQPSLWCSFSVDDDELTFLDGKNYCYLEWLAYLEEKFLEPWGYKLKGKIEWRGEDWDDTGFVERP